LLSAGKKSDVELWAELKDVLWSVRDASYDLRYDSSRKEASKKINQIYENLSNEIKLYVVNTSSLIEIANLDEEELKYEKARFLKLLPTLKDHAEERKQAEDFQLLLESKQLGINTTSQKRIGGK
jgi:tRNA(Ile)-lysidine synthase TilS/MesJ